MSNPPVLTRVQRLDSIKLDSTYFTDEGYLIDHPVVTSVGIFIYHNPDGSERRELRLPEQVFEVESLASYEGKPVIITHDANRVDKDNVTDEIVGTILSPGYQEGDDVRAKIIVHDIDAVKKSGLRELSLGYDMKLDETPGKWHGQKYDAIQTEIRINHLALVKDARAGEQARLNIDGKSTLEGGKVMPNKNSLKEAIAEARRKRRLDEDEPEETLEDVLNEEDSEEEQSPPAESPEERLQLIKDRRDRRDEGGEPDQLESAMEVIAQQDEDIGELMDIIEELQAQRDMSDTEQDEEEQCDDEGLGTGEEAEITVGDTTVTIQTDSIDKIVRERIKLGRLGDRLNLDGLEEMRPIEAKKAVIKKVNPSMRLDGKGNAYIEAAFDVAVDQINRKGTNYQRKQTANRADGYTPTGRTAAERSRERMIERQMNGGTE